MLNVQAARLQNSRPITSRTLCGRRWRIASRSSRRRVQDTLPGLYDQNDLDGNPIIGHGQAIAELILHRHFQTLDLTRLGWKRVAENRPFPKQGII